jgi:vacuolar protein sorting-associated protein 33A
MGLLVPRAGSGPLGVGSNIPPGKAPTNYTITRRSLALIVDEVNESEPDDIAYAFSGYAPLSVRLVQCVLQKAYLSALVASGGADPAAAAASANSGVTTGAGGSSAGGLGWRPFEDVVKGVKGRTVDETQMGEEKAVRARQMLNGGGTGATGAATASSSGGSAGGAAAGEKTVIVFFLGGVCRAEVASLRFVGARTAMGKRDRRKILICTTNVVTGNRIVGEAIEERSFVVANNSTGGEVGASR